jgi:hypothetical protein
VSELILLTSFNVLKRAETGFSFEADEVVGVVAEGRKTLVKHRYRLTGDELETETGIHDTPADKITEAFERTLGFHEATPTFINCHLFVFFAMGVARDLEGYSWLPLEIKDPVDLNATQAGIPYSTVTAEGSISHTLLGTSVEGKSLSVLGNYGLLAMCDNETLVNLYEASSLHQVVL